MKYRRFFYIGRTLLTHGIDDIVPKRLRPKYYRIIRGCLFWWPNKHKSDSHGKRLRLALEELGPVFVKFGQMLSTRRDILPPDMATELAKLQDKVQPFDSKQAEQIIMQALELNSLDELFSEFHTSPLASASVAQVHSAKLQVDNKDVVVKVLRPNIKQTIEADVDILISVAKLVQHWLPDGKRLRPVEVVREYKRTILDELDLLREAANGIQIKRNFDQSDSLYVPHFYSDHCRKNVIVMERIRGIPVSDIDELKSQNTNLKLLAERGVEVFFTQVFRDSFFHADMHPGNIFVSREHPENPKYIGIDYGIVGTLNKQDKRYLAENFIAFFNRNYRKVAELHVDSGWVPANTNVDDFEMAIRSVCEPIFQKPLADISFGNVLLQLFNTARRFNMEVQPQLVLLQKTLLYVEGLGRTLYPQLDLWQTAKPFLEKWMKQQVGVQAMFSNIRENMPYWSEKLPEVPDLVYDSLRQLKQLPSQLEQQQRDSEALRVKQHRSGLWAKVGVTFTIVAALMWVSQQHWGITCVSALAAIFSWYKAFKT